MIQNNSLFIWVLFSFSPVYNLGLHECTFKLYIEWKSYKVLYEICVNSLETWITENIYIPQWYICEEKPIKNSVNWYPVYMIRSSFWKLRPKKFLGKRVNIFEEKYLYFFNREKNCNLRLFYHCAKFQFIWCKKKLLASQKRDRFPIEPGRATPHRG